MSGSKIIIFLGAIWFIYALVRKPDQIAVLLFTLIVADVNIEMSPMNLRALVTIALCIRIFTDPDSDHPHFFTNGPVRHIILFFVYITLVSFLANTLKGEYFKEFLLTCLSVYLGYYYYYKTKSYRYLRLGIIFGGLICFADLAYTYAFAGGFPVNRVYYFFTGSWGYYNHNFFGYVCGTAFIFLLGGYLSNKSEPDKMSLFVMPLMFLGVLLSTSRGAMLAMIIVAIVLIGKGLMSRKSGKRAYKILTVTVVCVFISIFLFQILTAVLGVQSGFMTTVTARLIDEPIAMFNKMMGNRYEVANMDSMEWREEASSLAYQYYLKLPFFEQILGIGYGGFLLRDVGHGYDAHNGILLLLIETGVLGFFLYFSLIFNFWMKVRKLKIMSPAFVSIIFIILYVTSHNKEMTSFFAFLIMGSLIAELRYKSDLQKEGIEEEEEEVPALVNQ